MSLSKRSCVMALATAVLLVVSFVATVEATVAFHETFDSLEGWITSEHRKDYGAVELSPGHSHVDAAKETGLKLTQDARFYAVSKKLPAPISNDGKDFVISFSVKNEQGLKCGGAYLKLLAEVDQKDFHGESDYWLMFGPDRCGSTDRVHIIFNYKGQNLLWNKKVPAPNDRLTHVFTLRVSPDHTYTYYLDGEKKESGKLDEEWDFLPPKMIADPSDTKPADWVDEARIPDPEDKKPADWDDEPAVIPDATATKPEDWSDEEDGEWTAPEIPNPKYKGKWSPRMIANPAYKGKWEQKKMANPEYKEDPDLYKIPKPLEYVGIDVWQVEGGSIFDNIIIGDNIDEVLALVKETYGAMAEAEKKAREKAEEAKEADATPEAEMVGDDATPTGEEEDL